MSWLLAVLAAGGAVFFLLRARRQAARRFDEVLKAQEDASRKGENLRSGGRAGSGDVDRRA